MHVTRNGPRPHLALQVERAQNTIRIFVILYLAYDVTLV